MNSLRVDGNMAIILHQISQLVKQGAVIAEYLLELRILVWNEPLGISNDEDTCPARPGTVCVYWELLI